MATGLFLKSFDLDCDSIYFTNAYIFWKCTLQYFKFKIFLKLIYQQIKGLFLKSFDLNTLVETCGKFLKMTSEYFFGFFYNFLVYYLMKTKNDEYISIGSKAQWLLAKKKKKKN